MKNILIENMSVEELKILMREVFNEEVEQLIPNVSKDKEEKLISRKEAADILKISLPTLDKYTREGKVKGYYLNGRPKYKKKELFDSLIQVKSFKYTR